MEPAARRQHWRYQTLISSNERGKERTRQAGDGMHGSLRESGGSPGHHLIAKGLERGSVRLSARANDQVPRRLVRLQLDSPDLPQSAPEMIAGHSGRLKFRNDQSHPRVARRVVHPDHVQVLEATAPSSHEASANVGRAGEPMSSRQARRRRQEPPCFDGSAIVSCFRPFLRRRESTARPQRVAIRARNPCLLIRRLLRGRYDGFMRVLPQSEPRKLVRETGQVKKRTERAEKAERTEKANGSER